MLSGVGSPYQGRAMAITFACGCGKSFSVADELAGKRVKCTACAAVLVVPAAPAKPAAKPRAVVVVEDDEPGPGGPKKKRKKKRKKPAGIDPEEWDKEEEARAVRSFYVKRMVYIIAGSVTILASAVCFLLFLKEKAIILYVILACAAGLLGGLYCIWQGISGTFHTDK